MGQRGGGGGRRDDDLCLGSVCVCFAEVVRGGGPSVCVFFFRVRFRLLEHVVYLLGVRSQTKGVHPASNPARGKIYM